MPSTSSFYETDLALGQYLQLHYGDPSDAMPYSFGPREGWDFPVRSVRECLNLELLPAHARALDLGCAVGRTSFELSRYCEKVIGIDHSSIFIETAVKILRGESVPYAIKGEGAQTVQRFAGLPAEARPERVEFLCADALDMANQAFDVVIAANLICRLKDPRLFLSGLKDLVSRGGQLILTSPYSWMEEYTRKEHWLDGGDLRMLDVLQDILGGHFSLQKCIDLPFLIREHQRKFQWGVAQATVWTRNG